MAGVFAWSAGLGLCVARNTSHAQPVPWARAREQFREEEPDDWTREGDPDLVRAGEHATPEAALAPGTRAVVFARVDLNRDGRPEQLLTVYPREDPYPFNRAPGLVLVHSVSDRWRAVVVGRTWQSSPDPVRSFDERGIDRVVGGWMQRFAWIQTLAGYGEAYVVLLWERWFHDCDHCDPGLRGESHFLRLTANGTLEEVRPTIVGGGAGGYCDPDHAFRIVQGRRVPLRWVMVGEGRVSMPGAARCPPRSYP